MEYIKLVNLKKLTEEFAKSPNKYDKRDVTYRMYNQIVENMAILVHRDFMVTPNLNIEQLFAERIWREINKIKKVVIKKNKTIPSGTYINIDSVEDLIKQIKIKGLKIT